MNTEPLSSEQYQQFQQAISDAEWVDDDARLEALCQQLRQQQRIAVDTEFIRTDTFFPIPGLIQIGCSQGVYLIDPRAISDFGPFAVLLNDESVLKLVHAGSEDLELFANSFGVTPKSIFDTQTACAFLGLGLSVGYQRLLNTLFGFELDKHETRSDWLQRPLTESQLRYAAEDVVYLEEVYRRLVEPLKAAGKLQWVLGECQQASDAALEAPDIDAYYLRFKQAWKFKPEQLAVLQCLSRWREIEARARDIPRNFLLHNASLQAIATKLPGSMGALSKIERMRGRTLSKEGKQLLALVKQGLELAEREQLVYPPKPLPGHCNKYLKKLKALVQQQAEVLAMAPELLAKRKDLESLVRNQLEQQTGLPEGLQGWRQAVIGDRLMTALSEMSE